MNRENQANYNGVTPLLQLKTRGSIDQLEKSELNSLTF